MGKFSFVIMPDTQKLTRHHSELLCKSVKWITKHASELNIRMVLHVGDVVDQGADAEEEYHAAEKALSGLDQANIPLLIAPGNHDYDTPIISTSGPIPEHQHRDLKMFNQYFGLYRMEHMPWFGGAFEPYKAENMYACIHMDNIDLLVLVLEFVPRIEVMEWVDEIVKRYADHQVIVVTHSYMYMYGERVKAGDRTNPKEKYVAVASGCDGEEMWQSYLKHYPNLKAVFSGHHIPEHVSHRIDAGVHGNQVLQCFQNWQAAELGGEGRIRLVEWDPDHCYISSSVFNPNAEQFENEPGYDIDMHYIFGPVIEKHSSEKLRFSK